MNLVEKLIRIDKAKVAERETKKIKSKRLSRMLGEDAEITIRELSGKRINDIMQIMVNRNGKKDYSKMHDMNLMYCMHGIVDPPMNDKTLMEHFGASTPKDLANILFDNEAGTIADEIAALSGISNDDDGDEEEVKNS